MKFNIPWQLFQNLINNCLSPDEARELEFWRDSSELNRSIYDEILADEQFKSTLINNNWNDNSEEWNKIVSRIHQPVKQLSFPHRRFVLISVAAAILFLFTISGFVYFLVQQNKSAKQPESYTYIYSPRGQRTRVVLPDKTKVWLNSESSLKYPTNYNTNDREVVAQGEAYFEVAHNPEKPFYVLANEARVKVYGTSFNIRAFANEKTIEATLIDGKLSITTQIGNSKNQQEVFLKPNEKCIITRETKNIEVAELNQAVVEPQMEIKQIKNRKVEKLVVMQNYVPREEKLWKEGKLVFSDKQFAELAVDIERWFDVKIHFQDEKIKKYKFTGSFDKETINQAMEALKLSSQKSYHYKISFRDIYLTSN